MMQEKKKEKTSEATPDGRRGNEFNNRRVEKEKRGEGRWGGSRGRTWDNEEEVEMRRVGGVGIHTPASFWRGFTGGKA